MAKLTPEQDPTGLAGAVIVASSAVLVAVDQTGALETRWMPVVQAVVSLAALLWARRKAWSPASVMAAVVAASAPDQHPAQLQPLSDEDD